MKKYLSQSINYMVALVVLSPIFISFLGSTFNLSVNISSIIILVLIGILAVLYGITKPKLNIKPIPIIACAVLLLIFALTKIIFPATPYSIMQFGFYVLLPFLVAQQTFDQELVLRIIMLSSIPLIISTEKMLVPQNVGLNQADMYVTYGFVPVILAGFTHLFFCTPKKKEFKKHLVKNIVIILGYLLCAYLCARVAQTAVRGYWLTMFVFIAIITAMKCQKKFKKVGYYISLVPIAILTALAALNIGTVAGFIVTTTNNIVSTITSIGSSSAPKKEVKIEEQDDEEEEEPEEEVAVEEEAEKGFNVSILIKTKRLSLKGDLLNGRGLIWKSSLDSILRSPIVGNGIESMSRISGGEYPYPHNFALQLLQDCGIVALALIAAIFYGLFRLFKHGYDDKKIILMYFVAIIMPIAALSGDIWKMPTFWLFVGYSVKLIVEKIHGKNEN